MSDANQRLFDPPKFDVDTSKAWSKICPACGGRIYFVTNPATNRNVPVDADGTSHFATCSDPNRFSRKGKR